MSNTIPPLLSNSPPPIIGPLDDFDNDEFGDFNSAADSSYDFDVLSFPCTTQIPNHVVVDSISKEGNIQNESKLDDTPKPFDQIKHNLIRENITEQNITHSSLEQVFQIKHTINNAELNCSTQNNNVKVENLSTVDCFNNSVHEEVVNQKNGIEQDANKDSNKDSLQNETEKTISTVNSSQFEEKNCDTEINEILKSCSQSIVVNNSSQDDSEAKRFCFKPIQSHSEDESEEIVKNSEKETEETVKNSENEIVKKSKEKSEEIVKESEEVEKNDIKNNELSKSPLELKEDDLKGENLEEEVIKNGEEDPVIKENFENIDNFTFEKNTNKSTTIENNDDFDDFADFNDHITTRISETDGLKEQDKQDDDDDFDDFADFSSASNLSNTTNPEVDSTPINFMKIEDVEEMIKKFFTLEENQENNDFVFKFNETEDVILSQVRDVTETKALTYKWDKSNSQSTLFKALNIDMRNILYGPRWNETMPPFAATLGFTPLEPVKSDTTPQSGHETLTNLPSANLNEHEFEKVPSEDVPSAQFDWNLAGLTNPLDLQSDKSKNKKDLKSTEIVSLGDNILSKIGDDTSVKSLNLNEVVSDYENPSQTNKSATKDAEDEFGDFEEFTSYQYSANEKNKEIPLRETYISSQDSTEANTTSPQIENEPIFLAWSAISKPDPGETLQKNDLLDEFNEFQASSPPKNENVLSTIQKTVTSLQNVKEVPATFKNDVPIELTPSAAPPTEILHPMKMFTSYTCLTPLQPIPVSTNNVSVQPKIEWPEPGISILDDTELTYKPKSLMEKEEQREMEKSKTPSVTMPTSLNGDKTAGNRSNHEEDDWSDFISGGIPSKTGSPKTFSSFGVLGKPQTELQLSISQLNQIQPPRKPTPILTHQGLYMSGGNSQPSSLVAMYAPTQQRPQRPAFPTSLPPLNTDFQPSLISNQYARQVETLALGHQNFNQVSGVHNNMLFGGSELIHPQQQQQHNHHHHHNLPNNNFSQQNDDDEWSDFVSSRPVAPLAHQQPTNGWGGLRDNTRQPNWPATNITPNIITNPVSFDSLQFYVGGVGTKGGKSGSGGATIGNVSSTPPVATPTYVPSAAVPELDFVVPKSRTWKK